MIKNVAILFYLKKRTNAKEEKVPVYVRITCNGQRAELATGQKIQAKLWNPSEERAKGKTDGVSKLNTELNEVELKITDTIRYLKDCGEQLTAEKIKNRFLGKTEKPIMLIEVFKEHNRKVAALVNQEFAPATVTRYETTLKHTQDLCSGNTRSKIYVLGKLITDLLANLNSISVLKENAIIILHSNTLKISAKLSVFALQAAG
jgi:hypothetical protein